MLNKLLLYAIDTRVHCVRTVRTFLRFSDRNCVIYSINGIINKPLCTQQIENIKYILCSHMKNTDVEARVYHHCSSHII